MARPLTARRPSTREVHRLSKLMVELTNPHQQRRAEVLLLHGMQVSPLKIAAAQGVHVNTVYADLRAFALVAVPFHFIQPKPEGGRSFDGRGYTQARMLRDRYAYTGEVRAVGDVFRDAMFYMHRCGVNAFELRPGQDPADALRAFADFSFGYQGAADDLAPVFRRRRA